MSVNDFKNNGGEEAFEAAIAESAGVPQSAVQTTSATAIGPTKQGTLSVEYQVQVPTSQASAATASLSDGAALTAALNTELASIGLPQVSITIVSAPTAVAAPSRSAAPTPSRSLSPTASPPLLTQLDFYGLVSDGINDCAGDIYSSSTRTFYTTAAPFCTTNTTTCVAADCSAGSSPSFESMGSPTCVDNTVQVLVQQCSGSGCAQCTRYGTTQYDPAEFDKFRAGGQCHQFTFVPSAQGSASITKIGRATAASTMFTTNPCTASTGGGTGQGSSSSSSGGGDTTTIAASVGGAAAVFMLTAGVLVMAKKKRKKTDNEFGGAMEMGMSRRSINEHGSTTIPQRAESVTSGASSFPVVLFPDETRYNPYPDDRNNSVSSMGGDTFVADEVPSSAPGLDNIKEAEQGNPEAASSAGDSDVYVANAV